MASELTPLLLRAALFTSLAILVLLALRKPLRRWLGAALAYQAWLLVPLAGIAAVLPVRSAPQILSVQAPRPMGALAVEATQAVPAPPSGPAASRSWRSGSSTDTGLSCARRAA